MQLLWLFSALALTGAFASASTSGDCTQLPAFLEENEEGEPKMAVTMKEECAKSFTATELTECRKCANKISAAIFSTKVLQEQVTKIYAEIMVYTENGASTERFTFVGTMLNKYWGTLDQLKACAEVKEPAECNMYMYIDGSDFAPVEGSCVGCKDLIKNEQLTDYSDPYNIESGFFEYKKITAVSCDGTIPLMDSCAETCKNPFDTGATLFAGPNAPPPANPLDSCTEGCQKGTKYFLPSAATSNMNDLIYFDKNTLKLSCGTNLRVCVSKTECYMPKTAAGVAFLPAYCPPKPIPTPKPFDCAKRKDVLVNGADQNNPIIVVSMSASCRNVLASDVTSMIACISAASDIQKSIASSVDQPDASRIDLVVAILRGYQLKGEKADAFLKAEKIDTWMGTYQNFIDC